MNTPVRSPRRAAAAALVAAGAVALAGCSGSSDNAASSSAPSTAGSTTSASTSSSSSTTTSSSSAPSSSTSSATSTTSAAPAVNPNLVTACVSANSRSNSAVGAWNSAVKSQKTTELNTAAQGFRSAATYLRTLTAKPADKTFTSLVGNVSKDFDAMAGARENKKSVSTTQYNADAGKLRTYCQNKIQAG